MSDSKESGGMGIGSVLFMIFLVLKLTDQIDWSWWWITAPLWIPFLAFFLVLAFAYLVEK